MSWIYLKYRIRKRAEECALMLGSLIYPEEPDPDKNLSEYVRRMNR